jgi:hypothetical protein
VPGRPRLTWFLHSSVFQDVPKHFSQNTVYAISYISDTYGYTTTDSNDKLEFGLNANGKVLMWLGQLDLLATQEQMMLLPHNVSSDDSVGNALWEI